MVHWRSILWRKVCHAHGSTQKRSCKTYQQSWKKEIEFFSLKKQCFHIVRTFKMFCITSFERSHLLAHLVYLTQRTISYYSCEFDHYVHLTITVQDFINYMFMWFSKMHLTLKNYFDAPLQFVGAPRLQPWTTISCCWKNPKLHV
jgi:hypothetical protein